MKRLTALIVGFLIGAGGMYFAFSMQIVNTGQEYLVVEKAHYSLDELIYIDVSEWDAEEWSQHPTLQYDLVAADHADIIKSPKAIEFLEDIFGTFNRQAGSDSNSRQ